MTSGRSIRLAACLLLLLLTGWAARWWRSRLSVEEAIVQDPPGLEAREMPEDDEAPGIDQPPD